MKKILIISLILISSFLFTDKVFALDTQQTITNNSMKDNLNLTINYDGEKWVKITTAPLGFTTGVSLKIESNTGQSNTYNYNENARINVYQKGSKVYYFQDSISDNTKNTVFYANSYELIEDNNYIKVNTLKLYNGFIPSSGQVRYYDFSNNSFSDTYGGMNNFTGEGILYYSRDNFVEFTNDNTPNTDYNNYSKIYNFNLETPPPITPPVEIEQLIDLSLFMIISPDDLDNFYDKYNIVHLSKVESEYMITLLVANLFAYLIIILIIICIFKVLKLFFGSGKRNSIF